MSLVTLQWSMKNVKTKLISLATQNPRMSRRACKLFHISILTQIISHIFDLHKKGKKSKKSKPKKKSKSPKPFNYKPPKSRSSKGSKGKKSKKKKKSSKNKNKKATPFRKLPEIIGPNSEYVKLIASDGHEFIIRRADAIISKRIKGLLLSHHPPEISKNIVDFREMPEFYIKSHVLQEIIMYMQHQRFVPTGERYQIGPIKAMELYPAAEYLDI